MCASSTYQLDIELAIDVFKTKNLAMLVALKNFLTVLPNPKCIEEVLTVAFYQLANIDMDSCRWLLRNHYYLMPEMDVLYLAKAFAIAKLENCGFVYGKDFQFDYQDKLQLNEWAKRRLLQDNSTVNSLLLEEVLQIHN
ncbi:MULTISPECIES: hypothetical protein [Aerosakkonema]|uniref:hypothetical protein n=1 Tax=Aerosakkonema TaxID=1246629 RepID=UPI0035B883CC